MATKRPTIKDHLRHNALGSAGPACLKGRPTPSAEHFVWPYDQFILSKAQCERCLSSKRFAFLSRLVNGTA
jgi:hypothetical protein